MTLKKIFSFFSITVLLLQSTMSSAFALEQWRQFRHDWYRTASTTEQVTNNGTNNFNAFQILWKKEFPEMPHENANMIIVNNILYYSLMDGTIRAINATANTYSEIWNVNTGASLNNSPAVYDGRVYLVNLHGHVMALDATTGTTIWEYTVPTDVYSSILYANGRIFFGGIDGVLYAFDAEDGGQGPVWTFKTPYGMIDNSPAYYNGKIIFSSENMHAYALDWQTGQNIIWNKTLPGDKTWNGSPVVVPLANKIVFQTLSSYGGGDPANQGSTYRDVCGSCAGRYDVGRSSDSDLSVLTQNDTFYSANRPYVNENTILDTESGNEMRSFNYAGTSVSLLPMTSMYWSSIRWAVIDQKYLYTEAARRQWKIDLTNGTITRLDNYDNNGAGPYGYYVRGDENVNPVVSGRWVIGAINHNLAALNVDTGNRSQLQGDYGNETSDATPITASTFSNPKYQSYPGDGYTGTNTELFPYRDRVFYEDQDWLYSLKPSFGSVSDINTDTTAPSVPPGLTGSANGSTVTLSWTPATDNVKVTTYHVFRNNVEVATTNDPAYIDVNAPNGSNSYQVTALDEPENESGKSTATIATVINTGATSTPTPSVKKGDVNNDNSVTSTDVNLVLHSWFGSGSCSTFSCDLNGDGKINAMDASVVLQHFGQ